MINDKSFNIVVLDAHGVVFNNPFKAFLSELAGMTGQPPASVLERWNTQLRAQAWTGRIDDETLWHALTGRRGDPECWQALLETHYTLGPVAPMLNTWAGVVPVWMLSNHRTQWLHRRLDRFGLTELFDRILVSEDLGYMKPDERIFAHTADLLPNPAEALYIDDQMRNIDAAGLAGFQAVHVDDFARSLCQDRRPTHA